MEKSAPGVAAWAARPTDDFLLKFTHELRGRLSVITGWVDVLQGRVVGDEIAERALETIKRNAWAQTHLIMELLEEGASRASDDTAADEGEPDRAAGKSARAK